MEKCVTARGEDCQSGSFYSGPVLWEWFDYTSSAVGFYTSSVFEIVEGETNRAIILTVGSGGGGGTGTGGGGGGAGGVQVHHGIYLPTGSYTAGRSGGGAGERGVSPTPAPANGNDGGISQFTGLGLTLVSGGGEGGFSSPSSGGGSNGVGGRAGANSGSGFSTEQPAGVGSLGGGARDLDGHGFAWLFGEINVPGTGSIGGIQSDAQLILGGGGMTLGNLRVGDDKYGGGVYRDTYPPSDGDTATGGGGGSGVAYRSDNVTYWTSDGGSGRVLVLLPTNLCSSSLYTKPIGVLKRGLTQWIQADNANSFGKNYVGSKFSDLTNYENDMFGMQAASASNSPNYLNNPYTQSLGVVDTHASSSIVQNLGPLIADTYNVDGQYTFLGNQNTITNFENKHSIEWMGVVAGPPATNLVTGIVSGSSEAVSGSLEGNLSYSITGRGINTGITPTSSAMTVNAMLNNDSTSTGSGTYTFIDNNVITQHTLLYDPDGTVFESPGNCTSYTLTYANHDEIATYTPCGGSFSIQKRINYAGAPLIHTVCSLDVPSLTSGSVVSVGSCDPWVSNQNTGSITWYVDGEAKEQVLFQSVQSGEGNNMTSFISNGSDASALIQTNNFTKLIRTYNGNLTTAEMISNYSASLEL